MNIVSLCKKTIGEKPNKLWLWGEVTDKTGEHDTGGKGKEAENMVNVP